MSRTYKDNRKRYHPWKNPYNKQEVIDRMQLKRDRKYSCKEWLLPWPFEFYYIEYASAGPRWFRNMFMERPFRRENKRLETMLKGNEELDHIWPQPRKPTIYYW